MDTLQASEFPVRRQWIVAAGVDACCRQQMVEQVLAWAARRDSRYVCFSNAHMLIEARDDPGFASVLAAADLMMPDGRPLVWMLRATGTREQQQVRGPDAMRWLCEAAAARGVPVGFLGSTAEVLAAIRERASRDFPGLRIVFAHSPPFRALSAAEDAQLVEAINHAAPGLLFVGLGCPKQERWMAEHRGQVRAVMLGVGAAFDLYAGRVAEAPPWISRLGLEWAYRLAREPRRLLGRNLRTSPRFAAHALWQLLVGEPTSRGATR